MQNIIKKIIYKNRFAHTYFFRILTSKVLGPYLLKIFDQMTYQEKEELYNHVKDFLKTSKAKFDSFEIIFHFNGKPIKYRVEQNNINNLATLFAIMGHDIDVKEIYADLINHAEIEHFFDIGANLGHHSLLMLSQGIKVTAFEPNVYCHASIQSLANFNSFNDITLIKKGVGEKESSALLVFPENETWLGKVGNIETDHTPISNQNFIELEIEIVTIDDFVLSTTKPELIKIDTEGYELNVLKGCEKLLKTHSPFIIFEVLGEKENFESIFNFLNSISFLIYKLPLSRNSESIPGIENFDRLQANYLAVPTSKKHVVETIIDQK